MSDFNDPWNSFGLSEDILDTVTGVILGEEAPPDPKIKKWLEDEKVKKSFKDQYGEDYKEVMFAKAWKWHKQGKKPDV